MTTKITSMLSGQFEHHNAARVSHVTWRWPLVMNFIRLPLILIGQLMMWAYYIAMGHENAWGAAVGMANFYLPLTADLGCILLLGWLLRREHITLGSLLGLHRGSLARDALIGFGLFILTLVLFQLASLTSVILVYGPGIFTDPRSYTPNTIPLPPLWVFWWSLLMVPVTTGVVEELTYRGYVLPRVEALTGRSWLAVLVMATGFGLQHIALPIVDWPTSLSRFIATFLIGLFLGGVYLKQRRLLPLMIAHWGLNFVGLGLLPLLAVLYQS